MHGSRSRAGRPPRPIREPAIVRIRGREGIINLPEEGTYPSSVSLPGGAEIGGEDLTRVGVDREVQLSPSPVPARFA